MALPDPPHLRNAGLNRLNDQVKQEQASDDVEKQLKLAAQDALSIQEAKSELQNSAYSRLKILIGVFGLLMTVLVIFFASRATEQAVADAKSAVIAVYDDMVARFGAASEAGLRLRVAEAFYNKARVYARKGSAADAIMALQTMRTAASAGP